MDKLEELQAKACHELNYWPMIRILDEVTNCNNIPTQIRNRAEELLTNYLIKKRGKTVGSRPLRVCACVWIASVENFAIFRCTNRDLAMMFDVSEVGLKDGIQDVIKTLNMEIPVIKIKCVMCEVVFIPDHQSRKYCEKCKPRGVWG